MAILKIIGLDVRIAFNAAGAIVCGAVRITTTGIEMAGYVAREGYEMADNVLNNYCRAPAARSTVCATLRCRSCERMKACCADISQPFLTSEAEKNIVTLSSAAVVIGLGTSFEDAATAPCAGIDACPTHEADCRASAPGGEAEFQQLLAQREVDSTARLEAHEIERSEAVRAAFLDEHGFESVPEGPGVHPMHPLGQGEAEVHPTT